MDKTHLERHIKLHDPCESPFLRCEQIFDTKFELNENGKTCCFICPYNPGCPKIYKDKKKFDGHMRYHESLFRRSM